MRHIKFDESEILDAFCEKAMSDGLLDKQAEKLYPDFDISAPAKNELEDIVAVASHDNRLYGLPGETGEQLVNKAHPGGGTTIELDNNAPKDKSLAKVETIVERQKIMREIAEGKATGKLAAAVAKLVAMANSLDEQGDAVAVSEVDAELSKIARVTLTDPPKTSTADPLRVPPLEDRQVAAAAKAARIKANNSQVIALLNELRAAEDLPPLAASVQAGVITKEVRDELTRAVGDKFSTWRDLFAQLRNRVAVAKAESALQAVQTVAPAAAVVGRAAESGAPAEIVLPELPATSPDLGTKGPPKAP